MKISSIVLIATFALGLSAEARPTTASSDASLAKTQTAQTASPVTPARSTACVAQGGEHCCPESAPYHDEGDHSCWRTMDACAHHGGGDHHADCHYDPCHHHH